MANEKFEAKSSKEKSISDELTEIHEGLDKLSDKLNACFKKAKVNSDLVSKSVPQMVNQVMRNFSDVEMAICEIARRTKEAEEQIAAEKKAR